MHDNRLTHTDLKPENILLVDSDFKVEQSSRRRREVGSKLPFQYIGKVYFSIGG